MAERRNWTREEILVAMALYHQIPFGKIGRNNQEIISLAKVLGRTPSALAMKMCNLASFDQTLRDRNVNGLSNGSKLDKEIWQEFAGRTEEIAIRSAEIVAGLKEKIIEEESYNDGFAVNESIYDDLPYVIGGESIVQRKERIGHRFFHNAVLSSYENSCCITGVNVPELLRASHIKPWAVSTPEEKTNPANGLCLNALHDAAFDKGLITVRKDFSICVSDKLKKYERMEDSMRKLLIESEGIKIILPHRFQPDKEFLEYHNDVIFQHG